MSDPNPESREEAEWGRTLTLDNIDRAAKIDRRIGPEIVERVRRDALARGVDISARTPHQWFVEIVKLWKREAAATEVQNAAEPEVLTAAEPTLRKSGTKG